MSDRILHTCEVLYSPERPMPLVNHGVLVDEHGLVLAVDERTRLQQLNLQTHHHQILMPGVVNAHIHLTDAGRTATVPGGNGLVDWVGKLMRDRLNGLEKVEREDGIRQTLADMQQTGTVAIGEVANDDNTLEAIGASGIACRFIHELIGFRKDRVVSALESAKVVEENIVGGKSNVQYTLGAHAPYSVSPGLMKAISERSRASDRFFYQHLAEDPDERELYESGGGNWREFLERIGAWEPSWLPLGVSPIQFYHQLGVLSSSFVAVHLTDATQQEIALMAEIGAKAILSPTSNLHITGRLPRVEQLVESGMTLGLGTDGRGSNPSMDVFDEARLLKEHFPALPPGSLLRALTSGGADILQFSELGRVAKGRAPGLVAVQVPSLSSTSLEEVERVILQEAISRTRVL